ncbi:MAG: Asp23/Gls24 family envelope stress response protein [Anaerolineae bacterium]|nr:Asp23/Gls24 family envelope stress response protein [Anaerolineae bacterium]
MEMEEQNQAAIAGMVTVEPQVLQTIARLTTVSVPGVTQISPREAVDVQVKDERVYVDLHIIAEPGISLLQLGRKVQYEVSRSIHKMIGMDVETVNVYIEDVAFLNAEQQSETV